MSKIVKNSGDIKPLEQIKEDLVFLPSPVHRRAKTKFWTRYVDLDTGQEITQALAVQVTSEPGLYKWWNLPGFKEWFLNKEEAKERLEYLWYVGMDAIEDIFLDPDSNANAKVQALKIIANLANKEPARVEKYADEKIQNMSKKELAEYIKKHTRLVGESNSGDGDGET